jgi:hypothetical protein
MATLNRIVQIPFVHIEAAAFEEWSPGTKCPPAAPIDVTHHPSLNDAVVALKRTQRKRRRASCKGDTLDGYVVHNGLLSMGKTNC